MPAAGPRRTAGGPALSTGALADPDFRCSVASEGRGDDLAGSATHLRAFLVLEHHGPWGLSAPRDSRLPAEVKQHLQVHRSTKVLLARRHHKAHRGDTYRVWLSVPRRRLLLTNTVRDPLELCDVDLDGIVEDRFPDWEPTTEPFYGVCTHGRHDACCAERGRPVAAALSAAYPDHTWEVSHVGGDRFSANMVVLPEGLYYGRLDPVTALGVVGAHRQGRLDLDLLRGRSTYAMPGQHAEVALRRHLGEDRLDAVRLVRRHDDTWVFAHEGQEWGVQVARHTVEPAQLTCSALRLSPVPVFTTIDIARI